MRPLLIDEEVRIKIMDLVKYAEAHPIPLDDIRDIMVGKLPPAGDLKEHVVLIPIGYRIVYSIENQPSGLFRHLSMSVDAEKKLPNPGVVEEIMKLIGFKSKPEDCIYRLEDISETRQAINVLEKIII